MLVARLCEAHPWLYGSPCTIPGFKTTEQRHGKLGLSRPLVAGISHVLPQPNT